MCKCSSSIKNRISNADFIGATQSFFLDSFSFFSYQTKVDVENTHVQADEFICVKLFVCIKKATEMPLQKYKTQLKEEPFFF